MTQNEGSSGESNPESMAPPCDEITKCQSIEMLNEEAPAINQHNQTRRMDIVKDQLLNEGLYAELRTYIIFNEVPLVQCHTIAYVFHFVEFENLKYTHTHTYMLIYIQPIRIQNSNGLLP